MSDYVHCKECHTLTVLQTSSNSVIIMDCNLLNAATACIPLGNTNREGSSEHISSHGLEPLSKRQICKHFWMVAGAARIPSSRGRKNILQGEKNVILRWHFVARKKRSNYWRNLAHFGAILILLKTASFVRFLWQKVRQKGNVENRFFVRFLRQNFRISIRKWSVFAVTLCFGTTLSFSV